MEEQQLLLESLNAEDFTEWAFNQDLDNILKGAKTLFGVLKGKLRENNLIEQVPAGEDLLFKISYLLTQSLAKLQAKEQQKLVSKMALELKQRDLDEANRMNAHLKKGLGTTPIQPSYSSRNTKGPQHNGPMQEGEIHSRRLWRR